MLTALASVQALCSRAAEIFEQRFSHAPGFMAYAPGRVNLIGEHTDYNDGFVLPCAICRGTAVAAAVRDDLSICAVAADLPAKNTDRFEISPDLHPSSECSWSNYLRGMLRGFAAFDAYEPRGLEVLITGDIPLGAGLSSSASLEMAFGALLRRVSCPNLPDAVLAGIGQTAEAFAGVRCGIMDQMASACAAEGCALLLDCRSLDASQVPLPPGLEVMIINSNVRHRLVGSAYNDRRRECEEAAKAMRVTKLRDADTRMLEAACGKMSAAARRRARHVLSENQRVLEAAAALRQGDLAALARLFYASHLSMRDDFEITVPQIDALVEIVRAELGPDRGAVRMTGGGFGGSVVVLAAPEDTGRVAAAVAARYPEITGLCADSVLTGACAGVRCVSL